MELFEDFKRSSCTMFLCCSRDPELPLPLGLRFLKTNPPKLPSLESKARKGVGWITCETKQFLPVPECGFYNFSKVHLFGSCHVSFCLEKTLCEKKFEDKVSFCFSLESLNFSPTNQMITSENFELDLESRTISGWFGCASVSLKLAGCGQHKITMEKGKVSISPTSILLPSGDFCPCPSSTTVRPLCVCHFVNKPLPPWPLFVDWRYKETEEMWVYQNPEEKSTDSLGLFSREIPPCPLAIFRGSKDAKTISHRIYQPAESDDGKNCFLQMKFRWKEHFCCSQEERRLGQPLLGNEEELSPEVGAQKIIHAANLWAKPDKGGDRRGGTLLCKKGSDTNLKFEPVYLSKCGAYELVLSFTLDLEMIVETKLVSECCSFRPKEKEKDKKERDKRKRKKNNENGDADASVCTICVTNKRNKILPCGHPFCEVCITKFIEPICPNCRSSFASFRNVYL